jgi:hypothetical protein
MLTALLLMLSAAGNGSAVVEPVDATQVSGSRVEPAGAFHVAPLRLVPQLRGTIAPPLSLRGSVQPGGAVPVFMRLPLPSWRGATQCAARVRQVPPALDAGILGPSRGVVVDPGIRGNVSPCLK